jgi:hypothetical protein
MNAYGKSQAAERVVQGALAAAATAVAVLYEIIEDMYPRASQIELFARGHARPGWTVWGNEAIPSRAEKVNNGSPKRRCDRTPNTRLKRNRSS